MSRLLDIIKQNRESVRDITTLYIISSNYTILFANSLRHYYRQNIPDPDIKYRVKREYTEKIHREILDGNCRVLFLGFTHLITGGNQLLKINTNAIKDINNKKDMPNSLFAPIPKNRYGLIQIEQLNQTAYPYQSIDLDAERLIKNALFSLDYSFVNLEFYPDSVKNTIHHLDIFNIFDKYHRVYITEILKRDTRDIDILFIGTMNTRRQTILDLLRERFAKDKDNDINIHVVTTVFGDDLVQLLQRTKIVINLHYYTDSILEVFRIFDIMQNSRCHIISERPDLECEEYLVKRLELQVDFINNIIDDATNDTDAIINTNIDELYNTIDKILS